MCLVSMKVLQQFLVPQNKKKLNGIVFRIAYSLANANRRQYIIFPNMSQSVCPPWAMNYEKYQLSKLENFAGVRFES